MPQQVQTGTPLLDAGEKISHDPTWTGTVPSAERKWNDVWFIPAFWLTMLACSITAVIIRGHYGMLDPRHGFGSFSDRPDHRAGGIHSVDIPISITIVVLAAIGALIWLTLVRVATAFVVYVSVALYFAFFLGLLVLLLVMQQWIAALLAAFFVLIIGVYIIVARHRIPLAIVFIREGATAIFSNPALVLLVSPSIFVAGALGYFALPYAFLILPQYSTPAIGVFAAFALMCTFWWHNAVRGVHTVAVAHCVASWYITRRSNTGARASSVAGLGLALTKHAGSILYGALIIAVITTMRVLADHARSRGGGGGIGSLVIQLIGCCFALILACIEAWVRYVNRYALIYIGVHGEDFCTSCRRVMQLFVRGDCQNFMNDVTTGMVIVVNVLLILCGAIGCGVLQASHSGDWTRIFSFPALIAILMAGGLLALCSNLLRVAVDTIFVSYVEDIERNVQVGQPINCSPAWQGAISAHPAAPAKFKSVPMPPPLEGFAGAAPSDTRSYQSL